MLLNRSNRRLLVHGSKQDQYVCCWCCYCVSYFSGFYNIVSNDKKIEHFNEKKRKKEHFNKKKGKKEY
jgi:hypothetical protein